MSYENAKATKMLATHCAVCGRPLLDSVSVELGIGPDCRKKHGFNIEVPEATRMEANRLVHLIAERQTGLDAVEACRQLRNLGFTVLAERIATRLFEVRILRQDDKFVVSGPFTERAVTAFRSVPGRRWNKDACANEIPVAQKPALWAALKVAYPGYNVMGPDGNIFAIPQVRA